jgi:hypothetical protein
MFCMVILLTVEVLYGDIAKRTCFVLFLLLSLHVLYVDSVERICSVW